MSDPEQRSFTDTNIWLYAFITSQDETKSNIARKLLAASPGRLVVSTQVINEVCVNMLRKAGVDEARLSQLIHSFFSGMKLWCWRNHYCWLPQTCDSVIPSPIGIA